MEQFDILDAQGNPTGLMANKGAPLGNGQYYLGVHVYVQNATSGEFLLQRRALDKKFLPGGWDIVCEHTIAGETSLESAVRGVHEELGLSISNTDFRLAGRLFWHEDNHIVDIYFVQTEFELSELTLQPTEVIAAKFITKSEMAALVNEMHYRPAKYRELVLQHLHL